MRIKVKLSIEENRLPVKLRDTGGRIKVPYSETQIIRERTHETYQGPYEVMPTWQNQTLETREKVMNDNVLVYNIPISETTNPEGGLTLNVGG